MKEFIKIHQNDNVAVALTPLSANRTLDVDGTEVTLREDIPQGHKFALTDIPADAKVIKVWLSNRYCKGEHQLRKLDSHT